MSIKNIHAQLSKKHFIPPLTYADTGNANPEGQYFYISTSSNQNVTYTITQIGSNNDITGIVSNTSPKEIYIGDGNSQLFVDSNTTSTVYNNKGYIVEASDVVYVSIRVLAGSGAQAGALVSKGSSALGTTFRAGMFTNENPQDNYLSFISVMATEDNTNVIFSDLPLGLSIQNSTENGGSPISINLNEGESYIIAASSDENIVNTDGLIGTLIASNKDIVTNVGSTNGSFHNGTGRDYGIDQIVGADKIGSEYIFVKGDGSDGWENILIVANEDNTEIFTNGNTTATTSLNAGEYYLIEGNQYNTNGNMYVETSKDVFAYQGIGANNSEANQGLFFVPPLSCENRGKVDNIPDIEDIGTTIFTGGVTIVTNKGASVNINSLPISNFATSGPFNVDGNTEYVTYKVTNLTGDTSIESSGELYCAYFNQNGAASSGSFYSGFPSAPEINFNVDIETLGNCLGNGLKLQAANTNLFDNLEWFIYDNTINDYKTTNNTDPEYTPMEAGTYQLRGIISCTMTTYTSTDIVVSICPDDYDSDGIIDNIDIDIDNDGIINDIESLGNVNIDLSDKHNASALNPTNNVNIISNSLYTPNDIANSFAGDINGNFTSTIPSSTSSNSIYNIEFTQEINFIFKQNSTSNHTISDGESFILKIGPDNKNITLIDPDDQLLIDTNFDGEFETGVTNISASQIHFKFTTNTTGAASTFQFLANQVNEISFEHKTNGNTIASTFNGNIELTNFTRDSDGDGIEDMFDLDSNNDGVPDFFESTTQDVTLTNVDTNLDGLDDLFDTVTPNQDTDNDGISNYLDIDSDNDGIYDIIEAGYESLDTDNNGFIDSANASTVGINGLLDALETSPDSGILITPIRNSDSASIVVDNQDLFFNFVDLDADGDDCFDVIEAGYTGDGSGILNASPFAVNLFGKVVNNSDGYTTPNSNYTLSAPIVIDKFENITFCEDETNELKIESNADSFQWEVSTDGTTWQTINDLDTTDTYEGATTKSLQIANTPYSYNNYQFRVQLNKIGNSCGLPSNTITLTVNPKPIILNNPAQLFQCDNNSDLQTTFNLTEAEISITSETNVVFEYYKTETDAENGTPEVDDKTTYFVDTSGEAWVKTISITTSCYTISKIELSVSYTPNQTFGDTFYECDDLFDIDGNNSDKDGITDFDLSAVPNKITTDTNQKVEFYETDEDRTKSIDEITETQNLSNYRNTNNPYSTTIFYKIIDKTNNNCQGISEFYLEVNQIPEFSVEGESPDDPIIICAKNIPYTLNVLNPTDTYSYKWTNKNGDDLGNTQNIEISNAGEYTVTASSNGANSCSRSRTINVLKSSFETIDESYITITDDTSSTNTNLSIQINIPTNPLIYEEFQYALEDENGTLIHAYQDSNIFNDIEGGIYNILVENKNGCGSSELLVSVLQFPKFFTPNGDGENDLWKIKGANTTFYTSTSNIHIFNRFGKLVAQILIEDQGWDGTYNGKILPSDDYWFNIQLFPTDTSKPPINKKGHFSLLRR
ncbi:MAG: T9SS type B sorting domain-containing protein [Polaribacter sp.]